MAMHIADWFKGRSHMKTLVYTTMLIAVCSFSTTLVVSRILRMPLYRMDMIVSSYMKRNIKEQLSELHDCNITNVDYQRLVDDICPQGNTNLKGSRSEECPCPPKHIVCRRDIKVTLQIISMERVIKAHPQVHIGGYFRPACRWVQKVAIIVPIRDRAQQLAIFLHYMHSFLQKQPISYRIFVVEQTAVAKFNKGLVMNAGFTEVSKRYGPFDCYIFHDVDMLPEDDRNIYACTKEIRHMGSHTSKFGYKLIYEGLFGGVISLTDDQFQAVNGFSNKYSGWGGEDDDMYRRVRSKSLRIKRHPSIAFYYMMEHGRDVGNAANHKPEVWKQLTMNEYRKDGMNTAAYRLVRIDHRPIYTLIVVSTEETRSSGNNYTS